MSSQQAFQLSPEKEKWPPIAVVTFRFVACAGAGKTEAISRRVASLILEGAEHSQIIVFTFTGRAAETLRTRLSVRNGGKQIKDEK